MELESAQAGTAAYPRMDSLSMYAVTGDGQQRLRHDGALLTPDSS